MNPDDVFMTCRCFSNKQYAPTNDPAAKPRAGTATEAKVQEDGDARVMAGLFKLVRPVRFSPTEALALIHMVAERGKL